MSLSLKYEGSKAVIAEHRKDVMHLSPKAIRCIIEALEHYQTPLLCFAISGVTVILLGPIPSSG
jgi:hypothetical protein